MASILKVDELQGIVSAGDITVTSEGGSATQSLQQGLAKAWAAANTTAGVTDSFNCSTGTDHGTGDYTLSITSAMSSVNYSAPMVCYGNTTGAIPINHFARATASVIGCKTVNTSNTAIDQSWDVTLHGDLA